MNSHNRTRRNLIGTAALLPWLKAPALPMAELRKVAPDAAAYVAESNFFEKQWPRAFWGSNYPRLRAVKSKYDPQGLLFVHHGVGSEAWSADGFTYLG